MTTDMVRRLQARRKQAHDKRAEIAQAAQDEGRADLTEDEDHEFRTLTRQLGELDERIAELAEQEERATRAQAATVKLRLGDEDRARPGVLWGEAFARQVGGGEQRDLAPSGSVTVPSLSRTIVRYDDRPRSILELVPFPGLDGTDQWAYLRETERDHQAAPVAPGALKPTSKYTIEKVEDRVRTIAHVSEPIEAPGPRRRRAGPRVRPDRVA